MVEYIGQNFYIKPTYMVSLPEYSGNIRIRSKAQRENEKNLKDNKTNGVLSKKSSRKLMNAVNWLVSSAKQKRLYSRKFKKTFFFKINFITLTIPYDGKEAIKEKVAKKCLHAFLAYSRKYFYLRNYVWKFETTKAGQLHIHITADTYINHARLRQSWNKVLRDNNLLNSFFEMEGHYNPNSTDIHAVKKVKDVAAYIAKYMSKSSEEMPEYKGRIWGCNREISEANTCQAFIGKTQSDVSQRVLDNVNINYRTIYSPPDQFGQNKRIGEIFFMNELVWQKLQKSILRETYDSHRFHIRNNIEKMPEEYWSGFIDEFFKPKNNHETKIKISAQIKPLNEVVCGIDEKKRSGQSLNYQTSFEEMLA